jgi:hypothetical protein
MSRRLFSFLGVIVLALAAVATTAAQDTKTTLVQNSDGTWTVVEYPVDKEVLVNLTPTSAFPGAVGVAKIRRAGDVTSINLDLKGITGDAKAFNLYAVDPSGQATLISPVSLTNGVGTVTATTPLNQFMLVLSPESNLTAFAPETPVVFRSSVPEGFAVIPLSSSGEHDGAPVGEKVAAVTTAGTPVSYGPPLLGIPGFRRGTDTEMTINFSGALTGSRANVWLEPRKDGPTTIRMRFHELKEAPGGQSYVVWAVSPENKFQRVGQVVNTGKRNEAEIRSETSFMDFGLMVTTESATGTDIASPHGVIVGTVIVK